MKKILIIEDDKFLRTLIVRKLIEEGFETAEADDGEEGLKKVRTEKPDLILLDLILPGMDGFEVLAEIKKDPITTLVPIIILSNLGQKEDVEKASEFGVADYLIKAHFDPIEIIEKVKKILR